MIWAPAQKNASCVECVEIARELNETYGDERLKANHRRRSNTLMGAESRRHASEALRSLIGGTEEDAERTDALLDSYRYQPQHYLPEVPPSALPVLRRCVQHAVRTGHWLIKIVG